VITKPGHDQSSPGRPCWNKDYQPQALRVELADGGFYLFPYNRLAFVRFESGNEYDTIHVSLDTHEIQIVGRNLRGLGLAFHKFIVDWVRELPGRYGSQAEDDQAWIASITVQEAQGEHDGATMAQSFKQFQAYEVRRRP